MIMEYLQPIKLGWVVLTCKTLSDASQNQSIWRQIAKNNQEMYSWESITFYQNVTSFNQNNTLLGVPANLILKIMPSNISFDKKSKINEKNLDKNNNSSQKLPLTTKKIRLKYIDKLQDPKKSITEKIDQIKLQYKLLEQHIHNYQEDQKETGIDNDYRVGSAILVFSCLIFFLGFPMLIFCILWGLEKKGKSIDLFYVQLPIIIGLFIVILVLIIKEIKFMYKQLWKNNVLNSSCIIFNIINFIIIFLKSNEKIETKWGLILIPTYIVLSILILLSTFVCITCLCKGDIKYYRITILYNFWAALLLGGVFIVLLLASFKLDGVISVKWYLVFLPIFISFGLLLCIMCVMIKVKDSDEEDDIGLISLVYLCLVLLPIIIFLILYAIYLDYSVIDNFFAVLAPLFILHIVNIMAFIFILYRAYRDLFRSY
ncbi:fam11a b protein [Anaeramoeba flamelloides]|uniref:Fam11a b protein n=1 Tax=Anaeramoeba flamelloides TaxID=1746091 RepID=A0AAV7YV88_9EUKA|nr:fam11a b protein [Anaeramoeba flamelloides]